MKTSTIKTYACVFLAFAFFFSPLAFAYAAAPATRLKEIAHVLGARDNQLMGFGLVAGLKNTGDTIQTEFTKQALTNLLSRMGIAPQEKEFRSRNIASVMVTAKLPPYAQVGQKIDIVVSSLGDATSLQGGTLLMTPLMGADDNVYAVGQGPLEMGFSVLDSASQMISEKRQTNVGRILNGGIVEREVPVSIEEDYVTVVLDKPDYTTASRIVSAMRDAGMRGRARDAATIIVSREANQDVVDYISSIENLMIVPDTVARVVINESTGVVVMGENVKISPVAVSYGDTTVTVSSGKGEATLADVVSALNAVGIKPKDLLAIIHAIKSSGAISADIEVM